MQVIKILTFLIVWIIVFNGCSSKDHELFYKHTEVAPYSTSFSTNPKYKIKPADRLSIVFFEYSELSTKNKNVSETDIGIEVKSDGTIVMPLIGRVFVAGMHKEAVADMLYKKYSNYLEQPALRIEVLNQRIYVLGEVKNPGSVDMMKYRTISPLQAIVERGGMTDFARKDVVKVVRGTREDYKIIHMDLTDMHSMSVYNVNLMPDDIVYVAHNSVKDFNLPLQGANASMSWINTLFSTLTLYQALR